MFAEGPIIVAAIDRVEGGGKGGGKCVDDLRKMQLNPPAIADKGKTTELSKPSRKEVNKLPNACTLAQQLSHHMSSKAPSVKSVKAQPTPVWDSTPIINLSHGENPDLDGLVKNP